MTESEDSGFASPPAVRARGQHEPSDTSTGATDDLVGESQLKHKPSERVINLRNFDWMDESKKWSGGLWRARVEWCPSMFRSPSFSLDYNAAFAENSLSSVDRVVRQKIAFLHTL